jgi:hypothetical protein
MMRSIVFVVCLVCVATVLTEIMGLSYLWFNGQLNPTSMQEIRVALGEEDDTAIEEEKTDSAAASLDEVIKTRSGRVWSLEKRNTELSLLKLMLNDKAEELSSSKMAFEKQRLEFQNQLKLISDNQAAKSTEQSRGILLKMAPEDAIANLMPLTLEQNITLFIGMQPKSIALILQQFLASGDKAQVERGQQIFQAISEGQPSRKLIDQTLGQLPQAKIPAP